MSLELTAHVVGTQAVVAKYDRMPAQIHSRLLREVTRLGVELQSIVKAEKLTGQVLNVRTGRGRRSITRQVTVTDEEIRSRTGTNVGYMRAWEKGFHGPVQVRAHTRRVKGRDVKERYVRDIIDTEDGHGRGIVKWGRRTIAQGIGQVRAHTRQVNMDPRPFLRPSLEQMRGKISLRLAAALGDVTGVHGGA